MLPFVRLFYGNKLNVAVLTDYERGQKRKLDDLHKAALLENDRIILATEIAGKEEADIEDFFDPFFRRPHQPHLTNSREALMN